MGQLMPRMPRPAGQRRGEGGAKGSAALRQIWVLEDGAPRAVHVKVGISDGRVTEVESDALQPGMQVITDQLAAGARS